MADELENEYSTKMLLALAEKALSTCEKDYGGYQSFDENIVRKALILIRENLNSHICKECDSKQAQIDSLMLEFCPEEMSKEQLDTWEKNQRSISY